MSDVTLNYCHEKCHKQCTARLWFSDNPLSYDRCYEKCMEMCLGDE